MATEAESGKGRLHERAIPLGTRVLVTGGAGYIGSHTAKLLAQMGCEPVVFDNLSTGHPWAVKGGPLVRGDLGNAALWRPTLAQYRIQAAIHSPARPYLAEPIGRPRQSSQTNVVIPLTL